MEKNAVLAPGTVLPPGRLIPGGQLWAGNPARFVRDLTKDEARSITHVGTGPQAVQGILRSKVLRSTGLLTRRWCLKGLLPTCTLWSNPRS